jgi:formate hydrogenlyase subunit 3/multisubunit Na+/H+ antiporter MnhD subunit
MAAVNAAFLCADFISLYVALEVSGIAAFLLIAYPRTNRSIWVALRISLSATRQCCFIWWARC